MTIDFTEIPPSNKDAKTQDIFEKFAREFLELYGFEIIDDPTRGADGGIDIKVKEVRKGVSSGKTDVYWLVSCKHYAHTGSSITTKIETNILDRVKSKKCNGFIGFYTTIAHTGLQVTLTGLVPEIEFQLFDNEKIERNILNDKKYSILFARFFTNSFRKWNELSKHLTHTTVPSVQVETTKTKRPQTTRKVKTKIETTPPSISLDDIFQLAKSATIIIEIAKIEEEFFSAEWDDRKKIIHKLHMFSKHSDYRVAYEVFDFLVGVSYETRHRMPYDLSISIHTLILSYFPNAHESKNSFHVRELGQEAVIIAWGVAYDALIKLGNLAIAEWALTTLKFIYQQGKAQGTSFLANKVNETYNDLERTLQRPERNDLGPALELVKIFRADLTTPGLSSPILPDELYELVSEGQSK